MLTSWLRWGDRLRNPRSINIRTPYNHFNCRSLSSNLSQPMFNNPFQWRLMLYQPEMIRRIIFLPYALYASKIIFALDAYNSLILKLTLSTENDTVRTRMQAYLKSLHSFLIQNSQTRREIEFIILQH